METGIVKTYNNLKRFGFIKDLASQKDIYFHEDGLKEGIKENDEVSYELEEGENGLMAVDVRQL